MVTAGPWRRVDPTTVRDILGMMREYDRIIPTSEFWQLADRFGWRITGSASGKAADIDERGAYLHAPWDFGGCEVQSLFTAAGIRWISVRLTDLVYPPTSEARLFMQDAFAEYIAVAVDLLGAPTRRETGETQEFRWRGNVATVTLINTGARVSADLATNSYYDDRDISIEVDS